MSGLDGTSGTAMCHITMNKEEITYPQNGTASSVTETVEPDYGCGKLPPINSNRIFFLFKRFIDVKFRLN